MSSFREFIVSIMLMAILQDANCALYGQKCYRNSDCKNKLTYCNIVSPSCGSGTCVCYPGFVLDAAQCKIARGHNDPCDPEGATTVCTTSPNLECSRKTKRCECAANFRYGPMDVDVYGCIPETANVTRDQTCYDSVQCLFGMTCNRANKCQCQIWQKSLGPYACATREIDDACETDDECAALSNSNCDRYNKTCTCKRQTQKVAYLDEYGIMRQICVEAPFSYRSNSSVNVLGTESQNCNVWRSRGDLYPCRTPLMCTFCSSERTICARPTAMYSTSAAVSNKGFSIGYIILTLLTISDFVKPNFNLI